MRTKSSKLTYPVALLVTLLSWMLAVTFAQSYQEAPSLTAKVEAGELPPVEERLPDEPVALTPSEAVGEYGGSMTMGTAPNDEYLLMLDESTTETIPNLAEAWEFNEDGTSMTLQLRPGLKWSDGTEFTADDMIFWYEDVALNTELSPTPPGDLQVDDELIKMVKVDDHTVRFDFPRPYFGFVNLLNSTGFSGSLADGWMRPAHWFKKYHIKYNPDANQLAQEEGFDHWWQLFSLYSDYSETSKVGREAGAPDFRPWTLVEKTPSGEVWERNPYYFKVDSEGNQLPYVDRVIYSLDGVDAETRLLRTLNGEVDFNAWGTAIKDYPTLKRNETSGDYRAWLGQDLWGAFAFYAFNQTYDKDPVVAEFLRNKTFRQALSLAVNRSEINEVIALGQGTPRQATFHPEVPGYQEAWGEAFAQYDPDQANRLLDSIGLEKRNAEGWRLAPSGDLLTLVIPVADAQPFWTATTELVREYWRDVGVRTEVRTMDSGALIQLNESNESQMFVWVLDNVSPKSAIASRASLLNPNGWFGAYGPLWVTWFNSQGAEGVEPPEEVKTLRKLGNDLPFLAAEEQQAALKEFGDLMAENVFMIGTVGMAGKPVVAKTDLGNVREEAIADNADVGGTRNQWAELFYWKSPENRD